jgi:site-specific recombinase XerC
VRFLLDTGARRSEVAALTVDDIDLREKTATVVGKGRRPRIVIYARGRRSPSTAICGSAGSIGTSSETSYGSAALGR